jgi:hypothetical protein
VIKIKGDIKAPAVFLFLTALKAFISTVFLYMVGVWLMQAYGVQIMAATGLLVVNLLFFLIVDC